MERGKLKVLKNVNLLILAVILAGTYLTQIQDLLFLIVVFLALFINNKLTISFNMPGEGIYLIMLLGGLTIGIANLLGGKYTIYEIFKHTYYYLVLFLYWHIGEQLIRSRKVQRITFLKTVLAAATITSLVDIITCVGNIAKSSSFDINSFRNLIGAGNTISLIGVYLCLVYKREIGLSKGKANLILTICVISSVIHFSRMLLLYAGIFVLISGVRLINVRWLKYAVVGILCIGAVWCIFPDLTQLYINKLLSSFTEINFKTNIWNDTTIVHNWRGYEVSCAIDQFKQSPFINQLVGSGFGTTLDVKGYAYLVTNEKRLSFLHNGYFTQLLIWGILGIVCFFVWIILILKRTSVMKFQKDKRFAKSIVLIVLVANYFVMGPFFSATVASLFFYISMLFGLNRETAIIGQVEI